MNMKANTAIVIIFLLLVAAICFAMYVSGSAWWILILLFLDVKIANDKQPMQFREYQQVERFGMPEVQQINFGRCFVFPKIDGTNVSVWLGDAGEICGDLFEAKQKGK